VANGESTTGMLQTVEHRESFQLFLFRLITQLEVQFPKLNKHNTKCNPFEKSFITFKYANDYPYYENSTTTTIYSRPILW